MATATSYSKTGTKHEAGVRSRKPCLGLEANHQLVGQAYRTYLANGRSAQPARRSSAAKSVVAAKSRGARRAPAAPVSAPSAFPSGKAAALYLAPPATRTTPWLCLCA